MFKIGDRVKQQDTGNIGIVVGYGHRIVNNKCLTTIRVKLERSTSIKETMVIEPHSKWLLCQADSTNDTFRFPCAPLDREASKKTYSAKTAKKSSIDSVNK